MNWTAAVAAGCLLLALPILRKILRSQPFARASYSRQDFLLSPEERQLFTALKQAVGDQYAIFARIHVTDIIKPRSGTGSGAAWDTLEAAGEVCFPFVLCKQTDLSIACAIQLIQHKQPGRKVKSPGGHPLKDICAAAGLPLLRMEASPFYDRNDIRQAVAEAVRREPLFISETDKRKEPTIAELEKLDLD